MGALVPWRGVVVLSSWSKPDFNPGKPRRAFSAPGPIALLIDAGKLATNGVY
jgi:hypothetical protein